MKFTDFSFSQNILKGIQDANFEECTPVQEEVFRYAMEEGRDVTVQSKTGTGKTAAFLLTIFEKFTRDDDEHHKALIVAPTRELAVQIDEEAQLLSGGLSLKTASFYGGVGYKQQERDIKEGVDIIIGTPGRLLDFAQSKKLSFKDVDTLVIDEADRLFDMGFLPDLKKILRHMSGPQKRQTMLFSATLGMKIQQLAWEFLYEPKEVIISNDSITVDEISQMLYHVSTSEKFRLLLGIIEQENPSNAVIFTNTKHAAVKIAKRLHINGYHAEYIMGDLPQKKRLSIIEKIKSGELKFLVATDVAARGLHINDLDMVINYDIPEDPENYVHRVGRTARAGNTGKAVTLACERLVFGLEPVEEFIKMKIPVERASEELLQTEDKSAGMHVSSGILKSSNDQRSGSRNSRSGNSRSGNSRSGNSRSGNSRRGSERGRKPAGRQESRQEKVRGEKHRRPPVSAKSQGKQQSKPGNTHKERPKDSPAKETHKELSADKKTAPPAAPPVQEMKKPGKQSDIEKRLEYYRRKYGENFEVKND